MNLRLCVSVGAILGFTLFTVTGCSSHTLNNTSTTAMSNNTTQISVGTNAVNTHGNDTSTNNPQPKWTSIHDVVLAKTSLPGYSGQDLELVDVKGKYAKNPILGPFKGDNWTGQFQLRVVGSSGKVFSKLNLPSDRYTLFMRKFQFQFADYNGDGNPDFTLGQYAGSNGNWYELFTITPKGIFQLQTEPSQLFVSDFTYSPVFQKVNPNGFKIKYYDNAKVKWFQATYLWKNAKFQQSSVIRVND
ncbi:PliI family lysozyme inhibitor of I-type lysozyme [Alicyclobacillus tolerans]|uniref:PliI family lysozyme inhibitor of I-type lysozyme n=1 Tax=Alicyclobacillus tolerans TaxID=90970 RepID=UPI001F3FC1F7|nr:PliI family lysozyme inhibitor of I-type lysozyme [Alicyclobacillus tolerans]MCF8564631.1 PliI family lysozyme inhibitor of I-type lysozyme [Alicyclobacillus tolerans]